MPATGGVPREGRQQLGTLRQDMQRAGQRQQAVGVRVRVGTAPLMGAGSLWIQKTSRTTVG